MKSIFIESTYGLLMVYATHGNTSKSKFMVVLAHLIKGCHQLLSSLSHVNRFLQNQWTDRNQAWQECSFSKTLMSYLLIRYQPQNQDVPHVPTIVLSVFLHVEHFSTKFNNFFLYARHVFIFMKCSKKKSKKSAFAIFQI